MIRPHILRTIAAGALRFRPSVLPALWRPATHPPIVANRVVASRWFSAMPSLLYQCDTCGHVHSSFTFFCQVCGVVMKPEYDDTTHFSLLGLDEKFDIDVAQVEDAYKNAQMRLHPDRFPFATPDTMTNAASHSARLNEAATVLRRPLLRARYWMELKGFAVLQEDQRIQDMEMMAEIMDVSEELDDASSRAEVDELTAVNSSKIKNIEKQLDAVFANNDMAQARKLLEKLQMLTRLEDRMNDWQP